MEKDIKPIDGKPSEKKSDLIREFVEEAVSTFIPGGGFAVKIIQKISVPKMEQRQERWETEVTDAINKLYSILGESELTKRAQEEDFLSILLQAYPIMMKNHQADKINYIKNAIINSVIDNENIFDLKTSMFILIDELSIIHFYLLFFYKENLSRLNSYEHLYEGFENTYPNLINKSEFIYFTKELGNKNLIEISNLIKGDDNNLINQTKLMSVNHKLSNKPYIALNSFGHKLLNFIESID